MLWHILPFPVGTYWGCGRNAANLASPVGSYWEWETASLQFPSLVRIPSRILLGMSHLGQFSCAPSRFLLGRRPRDHSSRVRLAMGAGHTFWDSAAGTETLGSVATPRPP